MVRLTTVLRGSRREVICNPRCYVSFCVVLLLVVIGLPRQSRAQVLYGSVTGIVTDPSNAPIPGAKVKAINTSTGIVTNAVTDGRGLYLITHLQPGTYSLTFSARSFGIITEQNVLLEADNSRRVNVQLQLATVSQSVTVRAASAPLQTVRADVMTTLHSNEIQNLPLGVNRNYQTLYALVPGAANTTVASSIEAGNPAGALEIYMNGTDSVDSDSTIDGAAAPNFWEEDYVAYIPPAYSIQEVSIVTGSFDAELGQAGGMDTNVVTKSGGNAFHGSAWEYNTVSALQAKNYFYVGSSVPKNIVNQFGLGLGGPIKKNKLFFFGDWERYVSSQAATGYWSVPTLALRQGNFLGTGTTIYDPSTGNPDGTGRTPFSGDTIPTTSMSSAAQKMASLIPLPNTGSGIANNYFSSTDVHTTRDSVDAKINYNPTSRSTLFGRYSAMPVLITNPAALGTAGGEPNFDLHPGTAPSLTQVLALGGTYTFTPNLLLDANAGYTRERLNTELADQGTNFGLDTLHIPGTNGTSPLQGGMPGFLISGFASIGDPEPYTPTSYRDNFYTYSANLTWIKGPHSFRFGGYFGRFDQNHFQPQLDFGPRGGFSFTGGLTALNGGPAPNAYNGWADFLLGLPQSMGKDYQYLNPGTSRESQYALYARDQWQVSRRLNVDYGIRYEQYKFPTQDHYGAVSYDPTTNLVSIGGENGVPSNAYMNVGHGQVNPRLGVTYLLDKKDVIRAGYGLSTDPYGFADVLESYPLVISQQINGVNSYAAAGSLVTGLPPFAGPDLSLGKFPLPTYLGTQTFPLNFHRGYIESYNVTIQREFTPDVNAQVAYVGTHGVRTLADRDINAAGPGGGTQGRPLYKLWGNPNSISSIGPVGSSDYNSLQAKATWRTSRELVGVVYTYSKTLDYADRDFNGLVWSWGPVLSRNRAPAGFDRAQIFRFYSVYNLPFGAGQRWATHGVGSAILGGWKISLILSRLSGLPFTVTSSGASVNAPGNKQTADQVVSHVAILGGHGAGNPYFDPNAFAPVTAVRFGTSGRNSLRGPGYFNLDASVMRDFKIKERFDLQFRADAFGLTNTPQFSNPSANVSDATFVNGKVSSLNGYDTITSSTGQRQVRFALQLSF